MITLSILIRALSAPSLTVVVTATLPRLLGRWGRAPGEGVVGPHVRPALCGADAATAAVGVAAVVVVAVVMRGGDYGDGAA